MVRYFFLILLFFSAGQSVFAGEILQQGIERKVLEHVDIAGTNEEIRLMLVTLPPGAASLPHIHPVTGLNYIIEGTVESQYEGEPRRIFRAGDSYQDIPNKKHLVFRNISKTQPLKFIVAFKIKKGEPFKRDLIDIIEMLNKHNQ